MTESHSSTTREQQVTIAVNEGLGETLADQAAAHDSSPSAYATTLLEQHLQDDLFDTQIGAPPAEPGSEESARAQLYTTALRELGAEIDDDQLRKAALRVAIEHGHGPRAERGDD